MRRMVWVSLGAAGGIIAYRKAQELMTTAKEKGVLLTVTDTTASIKEFAHGASQQINRILDTSPQSQSVTGAAAAAVHMQPKK